jgi:hypothetical protein
MDSIVLDPHANFPFQSITLIVHIVIDVVPTIIQIWDNKLSSLVINKVFKDKS